LLGGLSALAAGALKARAQPVERMRRIGVLMNLAQDDPEGQTRVAAFLQALQELGWTDGRNARVDIRWGGGRDEGFRKYATELVSLVPDVILAAGTSAVVPLRQASKSVPIVFLNVVDPVGAGLIGSLAKPGSNVTGFTLYEYGTSGKWLELLKQIAPEMTRAAVLRDPARAPGIGQFAAIQAVAPSLGVELHPIDVRNAGEIQSGFASIARSPNSGAIVTASPSAAANRERIVSLATEHRLPTIYPFRFFVTAGGLISYGPDSIDPYRRAASYIDRILKSENPADMPVLAPTKYELVVNLRTAKTLGLTIPPSLLARADEVIE